MKNIKVLIVEDDTITSFLHKTLLIKHELASAPSVHNNGKEALEFMISNHTENSCYLVLLDLNMPVMNGWEFLEAIEKTQIASRTRVVVVTSSLDSADMKKAKRYSTVDSYLTKPLLDFSEIKKAIKQLEKA